MCVVRYEWGKHGNLDLHSWAFDLFTDLPEHKAEMGEITVEEVSERKTSKSCSCCGRKRDTNRLLKLFVDSDVHRSIS